LCPLAEGLSGYCLNSSSASQDFCSAVAEFLHGEARTGQYRPCCASWSVSVKALATYSGLSVRKLRDCLRHPSHPLPHYRVDRKILIRRSEFDLWIAAYRRVGNTEVDQIVDDVLAKLD
jgi:hypothetical protein